MAQPPGFRWKLNNLHGGGKGSPPGEAVGQQPARAGPGSLGWQLFHFVQEIISSEQAGRWNWKSNLKSLPVWIDKQQVYVFPFPELEKAKWDKSKWNWGPDPSFSWKKRTMGNWWVMRSYFDDSEVGWDRRTMGETLGETESGPHGRHTHTQPPPAPFSSHLGSIIPKCLNEQK